MFVVFVANLTRPGIAEAEAIAPLVGMTPYEARLALATPPPCIMLSTSDRDRAADVVGVLRSRGHGAHIFDYEGFTSSQRMTRVDDFRLEPDGIHRNATGELLPYGDVFAIIRAIHDTTAAETVRISRPNISDGLLPNGDSMRMPKTEDREHVAYFFRRSGERPWLLRERHTLYTGLGDERLPVAFANFTRLLTRVREAATMAVFDDRLVRRRVAEKLAAEDGVRTSRDGVDLLAHLLAMTIASQGGSPYR